VVLPVSGRRILVPLLALVLGLALGALAGYHVHRPDPVHARCVEAIDSARVDAASRRVHAVLPRYVVAADACQGVTR
jgi:hypothetical protein